MSLNTDYDPDNVFAKILRGDLPCTKVYEDADSLAFMDLYPQARGHTLVIPKNVTATNMFDIGPEALSLLINRVQIIGSAITRALKPAGVRIAQFNGEPAGQTVFHLHFHIIPVYEAGNETPHADPGNKADDLEAVAALIRAAL